MTPEDEDAPVGSRAAWSSAIGALPHAEAPAMRYRPGGELGRGGMGVVESAFDAHLGREVAVKRPRPGADPSRLAREARLTARLLHPAIPPIYDAGEDARGPFYTMPILLGSTLTEAVADPSRGLRALVDAVAAACRAVGHAHAAGVVHRDLKPDNLLLGPQGELWVLDWGLAWAADLPDGARVGTPGFQAPEQAAGATPTPAADVFGLGRTLAVVLEGRACADPALGAVARRATQPEPSARYPDGAAMAADLDAWLDGRLVGAHTYPTSALLGHLARRWRRPLLGVGLGALALLALGALAWRAQRAEAARADASHAAALALQAASLAAADATPEAEVLAAHALSLAESPLARGVWMASAERPHPKLLGAGPLPCPRPLLTADAHALCEADEIVLHAPDGEPSWRAPSPSEGVQAAETRHYPDGSLLLRRTDNRVELWREGRLLASTRFDDGFVGLAHGDRPAVFDERRVGLFDASGGIAWGPETCEAVRAVRIEGARALIGCRGPQVFLGTPEEPGAPIGLPGSPSALAFAPGPRVGTFEGHLLAVEGGSARDLRPDIGAIRALVSLPGAGLVALGERDDLRLLHPESGARLASWPRGARQIGADAGALVVVEADRWVRWAPPAAPRPHRFDRRAEGGIAALDATADGAWLLAGSATGEIIRWDAYTGEALRVAPRGANTNRALLFDGPEAATWVDPRRGLLRARFDALEAVTAAPAPGHRMTRTAQGWVLLPWSSSLWLEEGAGPRRVPLPHRPVAAADEGGALWWVDELGGVHTLVADQDSLRFTLPAPASLLAPFQGGWAFAVDAGVELREPSGSLRWRWEGAAPVTALAADADRIVLGDAHGALVVLDPGGRPTATVRAHSRRVSELLLRGERLFSASWDGEARAWSLADLVTPAEALVARAEAAWGLDRAEALSAAGGAPAGPAAR